MTALAGLVRSFAALLAPADGNADRLTDWITQARAEDLPHLHAFTRGLDLDREAVNAALPLPFHNGGTEGVNTKTKMIKRQMYGRAGFRTRQAVETCPCRKPRPCRSSGMFVLVDDPSQPLPTSDVQVSDLVR